MEGMMEVNCSQGVTAFFRLTEALSTSSTPCSNQARQVDIDLQSSGWSSEDRLAGTLLLTSTVWRQDHPTD